MNNTERIMKNFGVRRFIAMPLLAMAIIIITGQRGLQAMSDPPPPPPPEELPAISLSCEGDCNAATGQTFKVIVKVNSAPEGGYYVWQADINHIDAGNVITRTGYTNDDSSDFTYKLANVDWAYKTLLGGVTEIGASPTTYTGPVGSVTLTCQAPGDLLIKLTEGKFLDSNRNGIDIEESSVTISCQ